MRFTFAFLFLLGLAGCKKDAIQTYTAPKETLAMPPMSAAGDDMGGGPAVQDAAPQAQPHIQWTTPEGWMEQPVSSMRVGSFLVRGKDGQTVDVSVVPLSGNAGGDLANINRWRGQIQLSPLTEEELAQQSRQVTFHGRRMLWVDFANRPQAGNNPKRITAVIYKNGAQTWFFKMTGDDANVRATQPAFRTFLASLRLSDHD